jgi:hypothetical protein
MHCATVAKAISSKVEFCKTNRMSHICCPGRERELVFGAALLH